MFIKNAWPVGSIITLSSPRISSTAFLAPGHVSK
jgi:hypothetical protein